MPVAPAPADAAVMNGEKAAQDASTSATIPELGSPRRAFWRPFAKWLESSGSLAWFSSAIVHATLLVALSLIILTAPKDDRIWIDGEFEAAPGQDMQAELSEIPAPSVGPPSLGPFEQGDSISMPGPRLDAIGTPNGTSAAPSLGGGSGGGSGGGHGSGSGSAGEMALTPLAPVSEGHGGGGFESLTNPFSSRGGGLEGRSLENRRALALSGGGSPQSEAAVEAALVWLAEHQYEDGSWHFDFSDCPNCNGYCRNPGRHTSTTAATGLALLSFLGAGYTHQEGKYQDVVKHGLYYLQERMAVTSHGGDLRDKRAAPDAAAPGKDLLRIIDVTATRRDSMYSHGIASLAIVEAYAMTKDKDLRKPAELVVKFIIDAQYQDGGWRYDPGFEMTTAGDMTVSGWQITVLKSATLAGIDVPYEIWDKIRDFLDHIQDDGGSTYLYLPGRKGTAATTAIGLLCRMVTGWPRDYPALQRGVAKLGSQLPQHNNMYYNFYASQVLHHIGGPNWSKWNPKMRDYLVKSQATAGHETGSWYFDEDHANIGGRLYTTAMGALTLEVYYRHMPLYQEAFVDGSP